MEVIAPFADMLSAIMDQWALGIEMLGQHAVWLWVLPPVWGIAACMILDRLEQENRERERFYLKNVERNLLRLDELVKNRSPEVLELQRIRRGRT